MNLITLIFNFSKTSLTSRNALESLNACSFAKLILWSSFERFLINASSVTGVSRMWLKKENMVNSGQLHNIVSIYKYI